MFSEFYITFNPMNKLFTLAIIIFTTSFQACTSDVPNNETPITNDLTANDTFDNSANIKFIQGFIDKGILKCSTDYYSVIFSTINVADTSKEKEFSHTKFKRVKQCDDGISSSYISVLYTTGKDGKINDYVTFNYDGENDFEYSTKYTNDGKSIYCFTNYADGDGSSQICLFDAQKENFYISDTIYNGEILKESTLDFDNMVFSVNGQSTDDIAKKFNKIP